MQDELRPIAPGFLAFVLLVSVVAAAGSPVTPVPNVTATIERSAKHPSACLIRAEVRDPQSNEILTAPSLMVAAGQQASIVGTSSEQKVEFAAKAGAECGGGSYTVNVWTAAKLTYSKKGDLSSPPQ